MQKLLVPVLMLLWGSQLPAALIGAGTPIPASEVLSFGGLEWVYAGPIAPGEFGAGSIEAPSFRAGEG
ncbi:MAG: PEP-CTERM sorting domain-containing protein, partial [Acidobacteria bacterium]|nr:PEP-CTERM sorting domain-containing protein [Acidobacteriota bacterium]